MDLRQWLTDNILSYSTEEIIDPVPKDSVRCRRKLKIDGSNRFGHRQTMPTVCRIYKEAEPGRWVLGKGKGGAGTVVWKTGDPRAREEPTSRAVVRHYKQWRGERILTASFLRVGALSGLHLMTAGGVVTTICKPPMDCEPLATVSVLRQNPEGFNGFLEKVEIPNPERPAWDAWVSMIVGIRAFIENEVRGNVLRYRAEDYEPCAECWTIFHNRPASPRDPWRSIHGRLLCPSCYKKLGTESRI